MKVKVFEAIATPGRVSSIDILRCVAIIAVVIFHFGSFLPLGYVGVDLFFVISGLLIGNLLLHNFEQGVKINPFKFIIQRGLKIWPSYYFFFIVGEFIAFLLYRRTNPEQIVPLHDVKRYLFFYQNYTGPPFHFSFDHVWSLCVEEHFYILLPLFFVTVQVFLNSSKNYLFLGIILVIISGVLFKYLSFYLTHSKDTYSGTHNRIDALAWGVLLCMILKYHGAWLKTKKYIYVSSISGLFLLIVLLWLKVFWCNIIFQKIGFHSILPVTFFLIILGVYFSDFTRFKTARIIAYYSYNWYLWHPLFSIFIANTVGLTFLGLLIYLIVTFLVAFISTVLVEEPVLKYRTNIINKFFRSKNKSLHE